MTDKRFTQEEVRADADDLRNAGHPTTADMLTAYATLLEQIERAKAGVTDEVVRKVMNAAMQAPIAYAARETRKALQSIAHLLPSERGVVAIGFRHRMKGSGPEWSYNYHRAPDSFELRECEIETIWAGNANPPAQAAQVDADGLIDAYDEAIRRQRNSGFLPEAAQRAASGCVEHNRNRLRKAIITAPTAEPVAQGEAADKHERELLSLIDERDRREEIIDCLCDAVLGQGRPEWSSAYGYDDALLEVQEAMFAKPRALPDGWVLVPRKPTQKMVDKGTDEHQCEQGDPYYPMPQLTDSDAIAIYQAMIAAAPQPGEPS